MHSEDTGRGGITTDSNKSRRINIDGFSAILCTQF